MTNYFCPDCAWMPVPAPRPGKDGRCEHCRSKVGRRRRHSQPQLSPEHGFAHLVAAHNRHHAG